jgi:hypothetical protein
MTQPPDWGWGEPQEPEPEEPGQDYAPPVTAFPLANDDMLPPTGTPVEPPPSGQPVVPGPADAIAPTAFPPPYGATPAASPFGAASPPPPVETVDPAEVPLAMPPLGTPPMSPDGAAPAPYTQRLAPRPPVAPPIQSFGTGWGNTDELARPPEDDFAPEVPTVTPFPTAFGGVQVPPPAEPNLAVPPPLPVTPQPAPAAPPLPPAVPPQPVYNTGWGNTDELAKKPEDDFAPDFPVVTPFGSVFGAAAATPPPPTGAPVAPPSVSMPSPMAPPTAPAAAAPNFAPPAGPSFAPPAGEPVPNAAGPSFAPPAGPAFAPPSGAPVAPPATAAAAAHHMMYDLAGNPISPTEAPATETHIPDQWSIATGAPKAYYAPPVTEMYGQPPVVPPTASRWDAADGAQPTPSIHNFTPYVSPPRKTRSRTSAIVLSVIAVLVFAVAGVVGYHFWKASGTSVANPSGSPSPVVQGTTVSKLGITVTVGPRWTVVPTDKAGADAFFAQFRTTHPNYAPGVSTSDFSQLTTFALWVLGDRVVGVTYTGPVDGESRPSVLIKQSASIAKSAHGQDLKSKLTKFGDYPGLVISFRVPHANRDKSDAYWMLTLVHSDKTSAFLTVISPSKAFTAAESDAMAHSIKFN